ncbi:hypothetical protein DIPPA_13608 [Diplonema papillatum]|nr:hypothetical protein DIPPA_13608 [Diplonema papillatum]
MTMRFGEQPMRPWNGKWTPLRLDTVYDGVVMQDRDKPRLTPLPTHRFRADDSRVFVA